MHYTIFLHLSLQLTLSPLNFVFYCSHFSPCHCSIDCNYSHFTYDWLPCHFAIDRIENGKCLEYLATTRKDEVVGNMILRTDKVLGNMILRTDKVLGQYDPTVRQGVRQYDPTVR